MMISGRKRRAITFTVLGICLVAAAVTLNISWLVINWREGMMIVFGSIFFLVIIALGVVNTIFLVREIRRNEQHDSFINAVTHELKTPIASIRLYLETLEQNSIIARGVERLGMTREGLLRHHVVREGQPLNVLVYGMTRDQWDTNKQKLFDKFGTPQVISYEGPRVEPLPAPSQLVGAGVG